MAMRRAALAALLAALLPATAIACGAERWPVKTAADPDAAAINPAPVAATVSQLGALPAPRDPDRREDSRWPGETTVYRVTAQLTEIRHENDGDYHLVLRGASGATMIAEAPDPACAAGSRFAAEIATVRAPIARRYPALAYRKMIRVRGAAVEVTGVMFDDVPHGQDGVAPNAIELHPILAISFR